MRSFWIFMICAGASLAPLVAAPQADYKGKTTMDGAFTAEQAARGQATYTARCARCHGADLVGNQAVLKTQKFVDRWREEKVDLLFTAIKTAMPRGAPGSLSDAEYSDIVSFLLQENGMPAGAAELTTTTMPTIQFVDVDGPKAVPNLAIVQVTGCLVPATNGNWNLTNATEPIRVRHSEEATSVDVQAFNAPPGPTHTFRLGLDNLLSPFDPEPHSGNKIYVKGVLNRQGTERLNASAVAVVGSACP